MSLTSWWRQRADLRSYRLRHPGGLDWTAAALSPCARHDAAGVKIGSRLYLIGGYERLEHVHDHIDVYDFPTGGWRERIATPPGMPQSHAALAADGARRLWSVSGQLGPHCSPPSPASFELDVDTGRWSPLPPLPQPRYAATMQFRRGRLHVIGGAKEDRYTTTPDHWSLAPGESSWREEPPIPIAGMHRGSAILDDRIYVFGGQQGDFVAIPGDPEFTCTAATKEIYLPHGYVLDDAGWRRLPDMPLAVSHTESSTVVIGRRVWILGGQRHKRADTHEVELSDVVQEFDVDTGTWTTRGHLPYRVKTTVAAVHDGAIFFATGQRDRNADDPVADEITPYSWSAPIP